MAQVDFSAPLIPWIFTQEEYRAGCSLSGATKQLLQHYYTTFAAERLALNPSPDSYTRFIQQEAELKGKMLFIQELLDNSARAEKEMQTGPQP